MNPTTRDIIIGGIDPDAAEFCARSGATDRVAISQFVRGIKGMGLWEKMVCWPMISTQNAGTGTTLHSLGGFGRYNGTLTNGPTWGPTGISINTTQYIPTELTWDFNAASNDTTIFCVEAASAGSVINLFSNDYTANFQVVFSQINSNTTQAVARALGNYNFTVGTMTFPYSCFYKKSGGANNSAARSSINSNASVAGVNSGGSDSVIGSGILTLGSSFGATPTLHTQSFNSLFNKVLSDAETAALHNLYKSTLGSLIGLP